MLLSVDVPVPVPVGCGTARENVPEKKFFQIHNSCEGHDRSLGAILEPFGQLASRRGSLKGGSCSFAGVWHRPNASAARQRGNGQNVSGWNIQQCGPTPAGIPIPPSKNGKKKKARERETFVDGEKLVFEQKYNSGRIELAGDPGVHTPVAVYPMPCHAMPWSDVRFGVLVSVGRRGTYHVPDSKDTANDEFPSRSRHAEMSVKMLKLWKPVREATRVPGYPGTPEPNDVHLDCQIPKDVLQASRKATSCGYERKRCWLKNGATNSPNVSWILKKCRDIWRSFQKSKCISAKPTRGSGLLPAKGRNNLWHAAYSGTRVSPVLIPGIHGHPDEQSETPVLATFGEQQTCSCQNLRSLSNARYVPDTVILTRLNSIAIIFCTKRHDLPPFQRARPSPGRIPGNKRDNPEYPGIGYPYPGTR
eukprot:2853439-Rhodomonas_salina.2